MTFLDNHPHQTELALDSKLIFERPSRFAIIESKTPGEERAQRKRAQDSSGEVKGAHAKMRMGVRVLLCMAWLVLALLPAAKAGDAPSLDRAYHLMYSLDFKPAELECFRWQRQNPADPSGPVCEAANLLFSEFERLGILRAQFLVHDSSFKSPAATPVDPNLKNRFDSALDRAEALARQRLAGDADDRNALFALASVYGLRSDYAALIEKRNLASLAYAHEASEYASRLLALAPDYYDAYLCTGASQYIVGSLVAPLRWLLRLEGIKGSKTQGIRELKLTAERGHLLGPFARILLVIVYLREHDRKQAREVLVSLREEFPSNPLFAQEIGRIDGPGR